MQGGHEDGSAHLRSAINAVTCEKLHPKAAAKKFTPPVDALPVVQEIMISPAADAFLLKARELFAQSLAVPIAWMHLDATVECSRERKHHRVREGADFVVKLQQTCRCKALDIYFTICSFFAEEEFYLLVLPLMFWNFDYRFARQMTFIVAGGLLWGNLLKDVFRLPRPANVDKRVWISTLASAHDNTQCRDFGFPSTHTMNSFSNSLFTVLYCCRHGALGGMGNLPLLLCAACGWICSISFGRLYLGVHSPMDVKGGASLGTFIALAFFALGDQFDRFLLTTPHIGLVMMGVMTLVLVLNPQPRPQTPTFMQNCVVSGLLLGLVVGFRMETDRRSGNSLLGLSGTVSSEQLPRSAMEGPEYDISLGLACGRTLVGYLIILVGRSVLKEILSGIFKAAGLSIKPKSLPLEDADDKSKYPEIRGWDLFAAGFTKFCVYASLSWLILCGCPAVFEKVLGLPCRMNG
eukprot:TRINITY_DN35748_c0_g1_i1.p1 TRINITY_DN35748_c0_g1~~TRINITY_DN35748_c0_g1_i1.p1  ORF type:complete len:464 (-),score=79.62 TRINITY_DN35748_c0_g1_i1:247-1638(-)